MLHKYFYARSEKWQQVHRASEGTDIRELEEELDPDEERENGEQFQNLGFDPIDSRHLTSLQLIRTRLTALLESLPEKAVPLRRALTAIVSTATNE